MRQFKPFLIPPYAPADKQFIKWRRARQTTRKEWWRLYHIEKQREERRQEASERNKPRRERAEAKRVALEEQYQAQLPVLTVLQ